MVLEYHKKRGTRGFKDEIVADFLVKFPGSKIPSKNAIHKMWEKQIRLGTVNNCNSKQSPGDSFCGRTRTVRTEETVQEVKEKMDRDSLKVMGDVNYSLVNTARRNV